MSKQRSTLNGKLESLEKWRCSELDSAQLVHMRKQAAASEKERTVQTVQNTIDATQNIARSEMAANTIISVESLTRLRHFTTLQLGELKNAQQQLNESRDEVAKAQAVIVKRFEELTVVERLRKRRNAQADKEMLRKEQRSLDDQALLRLGDPDAQPVMNEQNHARED